MIPKAAAQRLKDAPWLKRAETQRVFTLLDGSGGKTRAVGGIVRDSLLDRVRDSAEVDFATTLLPDEVMRRAGEAGVGAYPTGIEHGTVTLRLGELTAEVTTLRQDIETDGRQAKGKFGTDWTHKALAEADIGEEARERILRGNAAALLSRASAAQLQNAAN